ncbi:hypothetical protein SAMD00019534_011900 [Acytostelium subglobosum LB1]|uniref:hypothetical protein n=1 Tax=Acytostelium subglobosum LB1 TaxID=1410327 RepID=UPI00064515CA|nr:hypothetical protein SAMD00019534_011900 [Acytostelium subglobosum LB1]GAM18015.1 hypothetical protein SAMD00019534_011900 [Acytostelium subglobosum LB1]|eukprot:XP_012758611.1 hypothetical protein SAMD00019534_011900 [Acytostelium subglobosum LB1]
MSNTTSTSTSSTTADNDQDFETPDDLPEQQKTAKRLLDVEEEEAEADQDQDEDKDKAQSEPAAPPAPTITPSAPGPTYIMTSPKSFASSPIFSGSHSVAASTHHDEEDAEGHPTFGGRRFICESGSDISAGEEPHRPVVKRKRMVRKEGKIYDILEHRIGSDALKKMINGPSLTFEWPLELVLVRHGQSEGNEAQSRSKRGDLSAYTDEFKKKHSSSYRLTDKGIKQAKIAGKWVRENVAQNFDRYYTSEYVRAMETSSLLGLEEAHWLTEIQLRERDKGKMDNISWTEKNERFEPEMKLRKRDSFFWRPPEGESIAQICQRVEHTFTTLRRECANKRVIIVCHGEIMWAFRVRLERLSQIRFHQLQSSKDPRDLIHNTSILWYTRVHPKTGELYPYFKFLRQVCPWRPEYSAPGWVEFDRPVYTNEELMQSVRTVPRYVNNLDNDEELVTSNNGSK